MRVRARAVIKSLGNSQDYLCESPDCACNGKANATFDTVCDVQSKDGTIRENERMFLCDMAVRAATHAMLERTFQARDALAGA